MLGQITQSIYYQGTNNLENTALPTGDHVQPGGLYMMDDDGGFVFQLHMPDRQQLEEGNAKNPIGSQDSNDSFVITVTTKHDSPRDFWNASATSYKGKTQGTDSTKEQEKKSVYSDKVLLSKNPDIPFKVKGMIKLNLPPIFTNTKDPYTNGYCVRDSSTQKDYYLYTVYDQHHQMPVFHTDTPSRDQGNSNLVHSKIGGVIYIEFDGYVYLGHLWENEILLNDPHKAFFE